MRRFYDPRFQAIAVKILPGDYYVTDDPSEMLVTVLGSCVAACIRDRECGIGGMNHFMLPESHNGNWGKTSSALRYGNFAMDRLIADVLERGGRRDAIEVKVFGGALSQIGARVGDDNAAFVEAYLAAAGLTPTVCLLRSPHPLRVHYFPATGRACVLELHGSRPETNEDQPYTELFRVGANGNGR